MYANFELYLSGDHADISVLLVYLEQLKYLNPDLFSKLNAEESGVREV